MLRGSLLAAALLTLLGLGSGAPGHVRNGRIAYVHVGNGNRFQIYTVNATGAHRHPLTTGHRYSSYDPAYSPRGTRIVFVRAFKQRDLWTMNADGTRKRDLTSTAHVDEIDPAWSPDGTEIAFAVESPAGLQGIWVVGADGRGGRQITSGDDTNPSWSPDGSEIAFQRYDAATQIDAILVIPAAGGTPRSLSTDSGVSDLDPAWSPDGNKIMFSSDRPDAVQLDLWVMNADGSGVQRVTNTPNRDESDPAWSPDGRRIVYSGRGSFHGASSSQLYVSNADGSNRRILTHACGGCAWVNDEPSWQPLR
jgi:Tol biopolymer transport system component